MSRLPLEPEPRTVFAWWARLITARPWVTLGVTVALTVVGLYSALQIRPSAGVQDMLADDQPAALAFGKMLGRYALVDDLIILVRSPPGSPRRDGVGSADAAHPADPAPLLAFAQRLDDELQQEPTVTAVRYRPSTQARAFIQDLVVPHGWHYLDAAQRDALAQRLTRSAMDEQFAQNAAMLAAPGPAAGRLARELIRDPLRMREFLGEQAKSFGQARGGFETMPGVDATVSRDGTALMLRVVGSKPATDLDFSAAFMPRIRTAVDKANADGLRIDYTGAYAIADYSGQKTRSDLIASVNGSIALLLILFLVVYRHPLAFPVLMFPVYVGIVVAFGLYAAVSGKLTPITAVAGAVLAGLGIDYCVHYVAHHEAERGDGEAGQRSVVVRAVASVGPATLAACATTLIGFASILGSHVRSLREFSMLAMLGLGLTMFTALTVLPATLLGLGRTRFGGRGLSATRVDLAPTIRRIAAHPRLVGGVSLVIAVVCFVAVGVASLVGGTLHSPLRFDDNLNAMHPSPHPPIEAQDKLAEVFGASPDSLTILVEGRTPGEMLAASHAVQQRMHEPDVVDGIGVAGVFGPASLLPPRN